MSRLRRTVDTEMSDLSVERWAKANGFVPLHGWMEEEEQVERIQ